MSIDVQIQGFRNIKDAHLLDENSLSIVVGNNESGKSSLIGAIQFACTGTAFGRKAGLSVDGLVSRGAEKMAVRVLLGNIMVSRTKTTGDPLRSVADRFGVTPDLLPLLFDAKMNGDGGSKAMRAFLDGVASSAFDAMQHFTADPPIYELVLKARGAGKLTTKAIIEYCESMRALQKEPPAPVMPSSAKPTPEQVENAGTMVTMAQAAERHVQAEYNESLLLGRRLVKLNQYRHELVSYEKQRLAASTIDSLKDRRQALTKVKSINTASLDAVAQLLHEASYFNAEIEVSQVIQTVRCCIEDAAHVLESNPAPITMPVPPVMTDDVAAVAAELGAVSNEQLHEIMIGSGAENTEFRDVLQKLSTDTRRLESEHTTILKQLGAWEAYERAAPLWEENKAAVATEWKRWDLGAKAIAAAETEHINKSGDVFGQLVADFSTSILQGRRVRISREEGIFLGEDKIEDCSESTRWRIEAAVMAAVGVMLKSPLLLLDGADVLDPQNKLLVLSFLLQNVVHRFKHTIVTTTTGRPIELEEPAQPGCGITKWIIDHGELRRLV